MGKLDGKVALITGAGQGVGQGIAYALAKEGASIAVAGRTESKLVTTVEQIEADGGKAFAVRCDVTSATDIDNVVAQTVSYFGGVDILVNNAHDSAQGPLLSIDDADFERSFATGPLAVLRLMRTCYPVMRERGGGSIINLVTAASVRWDASNYGGYAAIKEGMRSLTRAAACEWGVDGIRVNAIAPLALSPALAGWMERFPEQAEEFNFDIPLRRVGDVETDVGRAVAFLVSEDACYLTGATIPLDGGQARWC